MPSGYYNSTKLPYSHHIPSFKGYKHTKEAKIKVGLIHKGKIVSEKSKKKMSLTRLKRKEKLGYLNSIETRIKIGIKNKGKKRSKEAKKRYSQSKLGEKNKQWLGGLSYLPYPFDWTDDLKESIRERDNYACQLCGKKQENRALPVHHIDYNKNNCNLNNLITLCNFCHRKTNDNRNYYENYFKDYVKNLYC